MDSDIKCLNYIVCTNKLFVWECKTDGICSSCIGIFTKKLNFIENIECPICFEIEKGVQQLDCNHYVCIKCFKRSHVFDWDSKQPPFPYPSDIEDEYEQNPNHPKWENDELIKKYKQDWFKWEDDKSEEYDNEIYLRKCPLCRK